MGPISELSTKTMWRATTADGETQVFHLKLIAEDWAGPNGTIESVIFNLHQQQTTQPLK